MTASKKKNARPIIDLALDAYGKDVGTTSAKGENIDPAFKAAAMDHIKVFMFAGMYKLTLTLTLSLNVRQGTTRLAQQFALLRMRFPTTRMPLRKS